jgi:hypothetical protein
VTVGAVLVGGTTTQAARSGPRHDG